MASTKRKVSGTAGDRKIVEVELRPVPTGEELLNRLRHLAADWRYAMAMERTGVAPTRKERAEKVTIFEQMHSVLQLLDTAISPPFGDPRARACLAEMHSLASTVAAPTILELSKVLRARAAWYLKNEQRGPWHVMRALLEDSIVEAVWSHPKMDGDRTISEVRTIALREAKGWVEKAGNPEAYARAIFRACGYPGRLFHP